MEQKQYKRTTVTAALPYANGGVHIGHLAGVYVPADIYVRYLRLKKKDVVFIGGSDEHGVPVTIRARKEGITVQEVVDRYHEMIKKSFEEPTETSWALVLAVVLRELTATNARSVALPFLQTNLSTQRTRTIRDTDL